MSLEDRVAKLEDALNKIMNRLEHVEKHMGKNPGEDTPKSARLLSAPIPTQIAPVISVSKSVSSTSAPSAPIPKLISATPTPSAPIPKPVSSTPAPSAPIPKPTSSTPTPSAPVPKPASSTPEPTTSVPVLKPSVTVQETTQKRQIIKQALPRGGATSQIKAKKGIFQCPQCSSDYYEELEDKSKPLYTMGPGIAIYSKKLRCWNCGHEWPKPS